MYTRATINFVLRAVIVFLFWSPSGAANKGNDWPQYRGARGDGIADEVDLLENWPEGGPPELWRISVGEGYSGISVSGARVLTMDSDSGGEYVLCVDVTSGRILWRTRVDEQFRHHHGNGPRATPTIDGSHVYALSALGRLTALNIESGATIWEEDIPSRFGVAEGFFFGYSMSPILEQNLVLLAAGLDTAKSILAFDKSNGALKWTNHTDKRLAYSSPIIFDFAGRRQIVFITDGSVVSLSTKGELHWRYDWVPGPLKLKAAMPVYIEPDMLFVSMSYDEGSVMLRLVETDDRIQIEEIWKERRMRNHFNSSVFVGDAIYGFDNATLKCLQVKTGQLQWEKHRLGGKGSLIFADGHLIVLNEYGKLFLVEASTSNFIEKSRFQALKGRTWTSPTLANGRLFLRNQGEMACLNLKK
jgi:outer membrane protein assembly factor BamB